MSTTSTTLPSSGSKANVGCYEYHFLTKGINNRYFLVVQVVLVGKKMYEWNSFEQFFLKIANFKFSWRKRFCHLRKNCKQHVHKLSDLSSVILAHKLSQLKVGEEIT